MPHLINKLAIYRVGAALTTTLTKYMGIYRVVDSYGTCIHCFRRDTANEWLKFCSPYAVIYNRLTKQVVARRWITQ